MIISRLFDDWRRYGIYNCEYERPIAFRATDCWQLYKPAIYKWVWDRGPFGIMHPAGYRWEASVPAIARGIADPERLWEASLPHDIGYETQGGLRPFRVWNDDGTFSQQQLVNWYTSRPLSENPVSKNRWDAVLFAFALVSGVHPGMAEETYVAVTMMAWIAYKTHAMDKSLKEQATNMQKVVETTNGMNDARIAAEKTAALAVGVLEGRQQVRKELGDSPPSSDKTSKP